MKRRLITCLVVALLFFTLTGCGNKNNDTDIDDIINQNDQKNNNKNENDTSSEEVKLYSDNTKMVFNIGDVYYVVYYHDGVNVTGMEYIYSYPDVESAKYAEKMLKVTYEAGDGVKSVKRSGKQIKIAFDENNYRGLTVEQAKATYSMYEEIYNN